MNSSILLHTLRIKWIHSHVFSAHYSFIQFRVKPVDTRVHTLHTVMYGSVHYE